MLSKNQIKEIQSLQIKKHRDAKKKFIAEGVKTVLEIATHKPALIREVYAVREFIEKHGGELKAKKIDTVEVSETELKKISLQVTPNQVLALCNYFEANGKGDKVRTGLSFYLDDIRDPGNLGTIMRVADWFGMNSVYCSPNSCEIYNPKVLQASMGAFLRINVEYILLSELLKRDRIQNIYGAVLDGKNLFDEKLEGGLIVIGNEANGIHAQNLKRINRPVTIPAAGASHAESLNAAMAAAIMAAEFFRQSVK